MGKKTRLVLIVAGILVLALVLFGTWVFDGHPRSDPPNDFKRFVMGGPHWADEDREQGYDVDAVSIPKSVEVLNSKTFSTAFYGEGAILQFKISQKDLDGILATDDFEPTTDPGEKERLNYWSRWYLGVSSADLGPAPSFYITRISHDNVIRTLMAVNHERSRAIFLHVNFN